LLTQICDSFQKTPPPQISEFFDEAKGDALSGTEMSLALEKLNFLKLRWGAGG
jgi:hypothetical protein